MFGGINLDYHRMKYVRHGRKRAAEVRERIRERNDTEAFRRAYCARHRVNMAEYIRRLEAWRYVRFLLTRANKEAFRQALREQEAEDLEAIRADLSHRKAKRQEERQFAEVLDRLDEDAPTRSRLDESFRSVHRTD